MTQDRYQFGTWPSPISPKMVAESVRLSDVQWAGETLVWLESRGDRSRLLAQDVCDAPRDLISEDTSIRGRVGYGGGAFTVSGKNAYYVGDKGRLYRVHLSGRDNKPITPAFGNAGAPCVSPSDGCVVYVHSDGSRDCLAAVDVHGKHWPQQLASGADFVMQPAWHPNEHLLAYIVWDHPQMPWDGTQLVLAELGHDMMERPFIKQTEVLAGDANTAIFQPEFSPDGHYLAYISDATGFGQIYLYDLKEKTHTQITDTPAEHGRPAWIQGLRTYAWGDRCLYYLRNSAGFVSLHCYDLASKRHTPIPVPEYTYLEQITVSPSGKIALIASSSVIPPRILSLDKHGENVRIHARSGLEALTEEDLSQAEAIQWRGQDGEIVHGLFYAPKHRKAQGIGLPPLVVVVHGGPTSQKYADYDPTAQFFATRGYAVLYVNHRGSTGYGRDYMLQLRGQWGAVDVEDCASGVQALIKQGRVDRERVVILGGSAGGYTVLQSLVSKPGFYAAGIARYGISNQFMLAQDTHKFEERYNDSMLGTLPEAAALYRERSPLFHAERIQDPLLLFQGAEDNVVPQNQADQMVEVLRARNIPHGYHIYADEGHGFRQPENIKHYFETVLQFLNRYVIYR